MRPWGWLVRPQQQAADERLTAQSGWPSPPSGLGRDGLRRRAGLVRGRRRRALPRPGAVYHRDIGYHQIKMGRGWGIKIIRWGGDGASKSSFQRPRKQLGDDYQTPHARNLIWLTTCFLIFMALRFGNKRGNYIVVLLCLAHLIAKGKIINMF